MITTREGFGARRRYAAARTIAAGFSLWCTTTLHAQPGPVRGSQPVQTFDVLVYGGTAGGVIAAVSAARMGLSVALVEPSHHLGGMTTGGLSATDHGTRIVIGGYALEFYQRIGGKYGMPLWWYPEPRVAEEVLNDMITEAKTVRVFFGQPLREHGGVIKKGTVIQEIVTAKGDRLRAKQFLDSGYEGDLMAQAGVTYTIGRESVTKYGETLAGVRPKDKNHQFDVRVASRDQQGRLLPEISPRPRGEIGSGDARVQAYNFRLILSNNKKNQTPFTKPASYDPHRYEVLRRFIEAVQHQRGTPPTLGELFLIRDDLPWFKADFNNRGPFSTDYIGHSYGYPDGSYAQRAAIWQDHASYTKGLLFYVANDPHVPLVLRDEMKKWGLARDEFVDNGNWPYQLYIREGRRMVGGFVMTQRDIQTDITKLDAIAMGSYNSDSHNVQRFEQPDRSVQNEGNMEVPVEPYQIPYRVMLPSRAQITNLLVPVCLSASHVTYSTLRMEPQYMMIGQAAGVAAALAISEEVPVQEIDITALRRILKSEGMVDHYDSTTAPSVPPFSASK